MLPIITEARKLFADHPDAGVVESLCALLEHVYVDHTRLNRERFAEAVARIEAEQRLSVVTYHLERALAALPKLHHEVTGGEG